MEDSLRTHAHLQRRESRQNQIYTRQEHQSIAARLGKGPQPLAPALSAVTGFAAHQRRRGAGGARQQPATITDDDLTLTVSQKKLKSFRLGRSANNEPILLRQRPKAGGWRPVVALEDMAELFTAFHSEEGTGFSAAGKLYNMLHDQAPCKLKGSDGGTYTVFGLEGFDRAAVEAFLKECPIRADTRPLKPDERPAPQPIVVDLGWWQVQADLLDLGAGRDPRYRYVLVYIELRSRRVWLRPMQTKTAKEVADWLVLLWMDYPTPQRLQTDNGLEFCAEVIKELCEEWGVEMKHGQVGNPQTQGAVERANREVKDLIRRLLLACQTATWVYELGRVQVMINQAHCKGLGMSRDQACFGVRPYTQLKPNAARMAEMLGWNSSEDAVDPRARGQRSTATPATQAGPGRSKRAAASNRKRSAAEAQLELSDEEDEEEAALSDSEPEAAAAAAPADDAPSAQRSRRSTAGNRLQAVLAVERAPTDDGAGPSRALPARQAAVGSPAGRRRGADSLLEALAELAELAEAADVVLGDAGGSSSSEPASPPGELPEYWRSTQAKLDVMHAKNRQRISSQRRSTGEPKLWEVGTAVLLRPAGMGQVGKPIDPTKIVCRITGIRTYGASTQYQLRCNEGVLEGTFKPNQLELAPRGSVAGPVANTERELTFSGTDTEGVPTLKVTTVKRMRRQAAAERAAQAAADGDAEAQEQAEVGGRAAAAVAAVPGCCCRGSCGASCACKRAGHSCSRDDCSCKCRSGANCGNFNHEPKMRKASKRRRK